MQEWVQAFIADRSALPVNIYGHWKVSALSEEDLATEIHLHLQSKGKFVAAIDIVRYLDLPDNTIHLVTAQQWMKVMEYCWKKEPKGQYVNGHERKDVIAYHQNSFLPFWDKLLPLLRAWDRDGNEVMNEVAGKRTIVWTHDESTFYTHNQRKLWWVHDNETPKPIQKGEGVSLMVADFVSADYGWLRSPDGSCTAQVLFKAGKNHEGFFTNDDIITQASQAMDILDKYYPDEWHVLAFDNVTTHSKRPNDALSATWMPKNMPKAPRNFLVEVTKYENSGKTVLDSNSHLVKEKQQMRSGKFPDGSPQSLYFPPGHEHAGQFKGMARILEEQGINTKGLKAHQKSRLEELAAQHGFEVSFYPHFHCECNFIESNWGYAKWIYHQYPESSDEKTLEQNVLNALESVPLISMRCFFTHSLQFMDAYHKGLNGAQAAWANKKYCGHRVLLDTLMADLEKEYQ
ncbi:hypothetical protein BS47DRAFT_1374149 [Hydnum rufescens UP504]|uniref:Uncharacterized protein n=1 Tax=Hydnum rufescens UP504 TaxID=1448309 RepID=A0A9P6AI39_9AGAM|nr:hypothetical protein BS47DRAFT_1374149 [Hydnum rufescens UP504]